MTQPWRERLLDFLAMRGRLLFSDWPAHSSTSLIEYLTPKSWHDIVMLNVLGSERLHDDLNFSQRNIYRFIQHQRSPRPKIATGKIFGTPLFRETTIKRRVHRNPHLWVSQELSKNYDTQVNEALVGLLRSLLDVAGRNSSSLTPIMTDNLALIKLILTSQTLRHVTANQAWLFTALPSGAVSSNPLYRRLFRWARQIRDAIQGKNAVMLRQVLGGWLSAEDDDRLFELFVLSVAIEQIFKLSSWTSFKIVSGAVVRGDLVVRAQKKGLEVTLKFDRSLISRSSRYKTLMESYESLSGRARRPDLQIYINRDGRVQVVLLEAKHSSPSTEYARDSVYKAFGYLKDYESTWTPDDSYPRVLLVLNDKTKPLISQEKRFRDEVVLTDPTILDADLTATLQTMLSNQS